MTPKRKATGEPKGAAKPKTKVVKTLAAPVVPPRRSGRIKAIESQKSNDEQDEPAPKYNRRAIAEKPASNLTPKSRPTSKSKSPAKGKAPVKMPEAPTKGNIEKVSVKKSMVSDTEEGTDMLSDPLTPKKKRTGVSESQSDPSTTAERGNKHLSLIKDSQDSSLSIDITKSPTPDPSTTKPTSPANVTKRLTSPTKKPTEKRPDLEPKDRSAGSEKPRQGSPGMRVTRSRSPERRLQGPPTMSNRPTSSIDEDPNSQPFLTHPIQPERPKSPVKMTSTSKLGDLHIPDLGTTQYSQGTQTTGSLPTSQTPNLLQQRNGPRRQPTAWNTHRGKEPASSQTIQNNPSQRSGVNPSQPVSYEPGDQDEAAAREEWRRLVLSNPNAPDDPIPDTQTVWEPKRPTKPPANPEALELLYAWSQLPPPKELLEAEGLLPSPSEIQGKDKKKVYSDPNSMGARLEALEEARKNPILYKYKNFDFDRYTSPDRPIQPTSSGSTTLQTQGHQQHEVGANYNDPDSIEARRAISKAKRNIEEAKKLKISKFIQGTSTIQHSQPSQSTSMPPPDRPSSLQVDTTNLNNYIQGGAMEPLAPDAADLRREEDTQHVHKAWNAAENGTWSLQSGGKSQHNPRPPTPRPKQEETDAQVERFFKEIEEISLRGNGPPSVGQPAGASNWPDRSEDINPETSNTQIQPSGAFTTVPGGTEGSTTATGWPEQSQIGVNGTIGEPEDYHPKLDSEDDASLFGTSE